MPKSRLEIVGDEFITSIDLHNEFDVNFLLDRSTRPMCIWVILMFDIHVCCSPFVNGTFNFSSMGRAWHGFQGAERNYCDLYKIFWNLCKNFAVCQTQSQPNPDSNRNLGRIIKLKKLFMFDLRISIINK